MDAFKNITQTLWVGGLWVIGFIAAPVLFRSLGGNHALAGDLAGAMFTWMAWVGMVCGIFLLIHAFYATGWRAIQSPRFWIVMGMLTCTVVNHFAVLPIISDLKATASQAARGVLGGGFSTWHTISSVIYLIQCVLGLMLVVKDGNR